MFPTSPVRLIPCRAAKWLIWAALLGSAGRASAQTWLAGSTTPALRDLVSVDATGEASWIFGSEDVAGDGLQSFGASEQAIDVRSAYAALQNGRLALRAYVSSGATPEQLRVYVFVDVDRNDESGGTAAAPEIDPALDTAGTEAGYELVIGMLQEPDLANVWRWQDASDSYEPIDDLEPTELTIEAGTDRDPLDIGEPPNGYLQATLDPRPLEIPATCAVDLLFRASDAAGGGDSDVGEAGPCRPVDGDQNGVADIAEVDASCESDEQCPAGGSCVDGQCRAPELVLGAGEVVRGGAFACSAAEPVGGSRGGVWLGGAMALAVALGLCVSRRGSRRGGER